MSRSTVVGPTQEVTHRAADEVGRRQAVEGGQQPLHAGKTADALTKIGGQCGHAAILAMANC